MSNQPIRYKLDTAITITKQTWSGPVAPDGSIDEGQGYWNDSYANNERLTVNESLNLGAMDFMGIMKVLGKMHDAIKAIQKEEK